MTDNSIVASVRLKLLHIFPKKEKCIYFLDQSEDLFIISSKNDISLLNINYTLFSTNALDMKPIANKSLVNKCFTITGNISPSQSPPYKFQDFVLKAFVIQKITSVSLIGLGQPINANKIAQIRSALPFNTPADFGIGSWSDFND